MLLGIDVSYYQKVMDWQKAWDAGARYAFIRAGYSSTIYDRNYTDTQFVRNASLAPEIMPVGYYWFFMPNHNPAVQADFFCDLILDKVALLRPAVDVERNGGMNAESVAASVEAFVRRIHVNLEVWPLIYTRASIWNPYVAARALWPTLDLWIARYTSLPKPWGNPYDSPNMKPRDWEDWVFWQWSADGNRRGLEFGAQSLSIDIDYFNGDESAFQTYCGYEEVSLDVRVNRLEVEARAHGWSV